MNGNENTFTTFGYVPTSVNMDTAAENLNLGMPSTASANFQVANEAGIYPYMPLEGVIFNEFTAAGNYQQAITYFYYNIDSNTNHYMVPYSYLELEGYFVGTLFGVPGVSHDFLKIVFLLDINNINNTTSTLPTFHDDLLNNSQTYNFFYPSGTYLSYQVASSYKRYQLRLGIQAYRAGSYHFSYTFM